MRRTAVLVAGMHRSGTSALTRLFVGLGCDAPRTLMQADAHNALGYWESSVIAELNEAVLASAGSSWDDSGPFNPGWQASPAAAPYRERALEALEREFGDSPLFVLKDPRICRLLTFWKAVVAQFGAEPCVAIPVRNPMEVAASLAQRDLIEEPLGALLWLRNVLDAEAGCRDDTRVFIRYDDLLANWESVAERLGRKLSIVWPRRSGQAALDIEENLLSTLKHQVRADADVHEAPGVADWVKITYAILTRWARDDVRAGDEVRLEATRSAFDEAEAAFRRSLALGLRARQKEARLDGELAERQREVEALAARVDAKDRQLADLGSALTERDVRIDALEHQVLGRDGRLEALERRVLGRDGRVDALERRVLSLDGQIDAKDRQLADLGSALTERDVRIDALEHQVLGRDGQIDAKDRQLADLGNTLTERDVRIDALEHQVLDRDGQIDAKDRQLADLGSALTERDGQIDAKDRQLADLGSALTERDVRIDALEHQVLDRDGQIDAKDRQLADLGSALTEQDVRIDALEHQMLGRDGQIDAKDRQLADLGSALAERDGQIDAKDRQLADLGSALTERDVRIDALETQVLDQDRRIDAAEVRARAQAQEVDALHASTSWRVTRPLRGAKRIWAAASRNGAKALGFAFMLPARLAWRLLPLPKARKEHIRRAALRRLPKRLAGHNASLYDRAGGYVHASRLDLADYNHRAAQGKGAVPILFDPDWYLANNEDVRLGGVDPIGHYLEWGAVEGRLPMPIASDDIEPMIESLHRLDLKDSSAFSFDGAFYKALHPDLASLDDAALAQHHEAHGRAESRVASKGEFVDQLCRHPAEIPLDFHADEYIGLYPDLSGFAERPALEALRHYMLHGRWEPRLHTLRGDAPSPTRQAAEAPSIAGERRPLCVLAHVYYPDLWPELCTYIDNLPPASYDLYVNLVDATFSQEMLAAVRTAYPVARVYISENIGRDIGGYFQLLSNIRMEDYAAFCLLHTKRSPHMAPGEVQRWRRKLLMPLLGSPERASENLERMCADGAIGQLGAEACRYTELNDNPEKYFDALKRLDIHENTAHVEFLSGTMMFVRSEVLRRVFEGLRDVPFEAGDGGSLAFHRDGQWAHAVERAIGAVVRDMGYRFEWRAAEGA